MTYGFDLYDTQDDLHARGDRRVISRAQRDAALKAGLIAQDGTSFYRTDAGREEELQQLLDRPELKGR